MTVLCGWTSSSLDDCLPARLSTPAEDAEKYSYLLPGRQFTFFSVGPAALADGVHDFVLSPVDAVTSNGNMSPAFAAWIRSNGREMASFPSDVYGSVELWQVGSVPFDAQADTVDIPAGVFINTKGSHCGGFRVSNSPGSPLYTIFTATGGKAVLGPPRSTAFRTRSGTTEQLFDGGVLVAPRPGLSTPQRGMLPVVADLAARAPARYAAAHLPLVVVARPTAVRTAWLTDPDIRRAYLGSSRLSVASIARGRREFGVPLGPPHRVGDDVVAQAFAGAVLEHAPGSDDVHAADIASLLESTGVVRGPPCRPTATVAAGFATCHPARFRHAHDGGTVPPNLGGRASRLRRDRLCTVASASSFGPPGQTCP